MMAFLFPGLHLLKERKLLPGLLLLSVFLFCLFYGYSYGTNRLLVSAFLKENAQETVVVKSYATIVYSLEIQGAGRHAVYPMHWQTPPLRRAFPAYRIVWWLSVLFLAACYGINAWLLYRERSHP